MSKFTLPTALDTAEQRQAAIRTVLDEVSARFAALRPPRVPVPCAACDGKGVVVITRVMSPTMTSKMDKVCDKCPNYSNRDRNADCPDAICVDLCNWQWGVEKSFGKNTKTDLLAAMASWVGNEREMVLLALLMQQMKL